MSPLRIGFTGYDNANALDLVGPAEAFASAFREDAKGRPEERYFGREVASNAAAYMEYQGKGWIV